MSSAPESLYWCDTLNLQSMIQTSFSTFSALTLTLLELHATS